MIAHVHQRAKGHALLMLAPSEAAVWLVIIPLLHVDLTDRMK